MIFLDARKYIAAAIESVLAQSIDDWELVLVDDGSGDGSRTIADAYAARDSERIRVYTHPGGANLGTGPSRNLGMEQARGRYLAFLDADDLYHPERLERCVRVLDDHPELGVVISRELYWRRWGDGGNRSLLPDKVVGPSAAYDRAIPPPQLIASILGTRGTPMPAICSITFRRDTINALGGIPERFDSQYEDQVLVVKLLLTCSVMVIPDCLAKYRQHAESLTHMARRMGTYRPGQPCEARRSFIEWLAEYLRSEHIDDPVLNLVTAAELAKASGYTPAARITQARKLVARFVLAAAAVVLPRCAMDKLITRYWAAEKARIARQAALNARRGENRETENFR